MQHCSMLLRHRRGQWSIEYVEEAMFIQGHVYRRSDLHNQYGGQRQGEISTPSRYPFVMLFTGKGGEQHGYADSWSADGLFL